MTNVTAFMFYSFQIYSSKTPGVQGLNISSILLFNVLYPPCSSKIIKKIEYYFFYLLGNASFPHKDNRVNSRACLETGRTARYIT